MLRRSLWVFSQLKMQLLEKLHNPQWIQGRVLGTHQPQNQPVLCWKSVFPHAKPDSFPSLCPGGASPSF